MSQQRQQYQMGVVSTGENNGGQQQFVNKTFTKIFVGGLAWETHRESLGNYFDQFGEILEAVVITDKLTGKSKGYGFVTFKDADSAWRACQDPYPVIDGRRANCNIAYLGSQKTPPFAPQHRMQRFRQASPGIHHQPNPQYAFSYPSFSRYPSYPPQGIYPMNYYNAGQQLPSYYANAAASRSPGFYYNYYPFHAQYAQNSSTQGFRIHQYPQTMQYPYLPHYVPQQYRGIGLLSVPTSPSSAADALTVVNVAGATTTTSAAAAEEASEQKSSA